MTKTATAAITTTTRMFIVTFYLVSSYIVWVSAPIGFDFFYQFLKDHVTLRTLDWMKNLEDEYIAVLSAPKITQKQCKI